MRPLLIVLAGACASVGTSGLVWLTLIEATSPYCEVVQSRLLRTTACEWQVNLAVDEALQSVRRPTSNAGQDLAEGQFRQAVDIFFTKPDLLGNCQERVSRLVRTQLDQAGQQLSVEVLRGEAMPTLVFIEHDSSETREKIAQQIATTLASQGVQRR